MLAIGAIARRSRADLRMRSALTMSILEDGTMSKRLGSTNARVKARNGEPHRWLKEIPSAAGYVSLGNYPSEDRKEDLPR